jgi:hypothetical protein
MYMRTLLKSLLATAAFLTLAPTPASALPKQCSEVCTCNTSCTIRCAIGSTVVNCGVEGICIGQCAAPSDEQASVSEETEASEDSLPVCEEPEAPEASRSVES